MPWLILGLAVLCAIIVAFIVRELALWARHPRMAETLGLRSLGERGEEVKPLIPKGTPVPVEITTPFVTAYVEQAVF